MRTGEITRKTAETDISVSLRLEGAGNAEISVKSGFFNHMLTLFTVHGMFDLKIVCDGDVDVDFHHSAEDIGICLGRAFSEALGNKLGIRRYADIILPMDEALVMFAVDISGRQFLGYDVSLPTEKVGDIDTEVFEEFLRAFVANAGVTLHIRALAGKNTHHIIEAVFKALGRVMRNACEIDERNAGKVVSSKGVLE